ncbi:acyltransferase [Candidatus Microgenomates bacterium]|nr:acyltransferase [Candidatus Microgenomates bacterium]
MRKRYEEIDIMRGLAIIAMIAIHTAAWYPRDPQVYALWDTLEFAVPIFIFCSAYLFFKQEYHRHITHTLGYFKIRLLRMLVPYYGFLLIYVPLVAYYEPKKVTQAFIVDNIFLAGGLDFNWMVLLFLLLSFLMPVLLYLLTSRRKVFYFHIALALGSSILFLFWRPYEHYRMLMILPWSLLIVFSWMVAKYQDNLEVMTKLFGASIGAFVAARAVLMLQRAPLDHFSNKYPPNLYHLAFGFVSIIGLFFLSHILKNSHGYVRQVISFFSKHSYTIYFIHITVIYIITVVQKATFKSHTFVSFFTEVLVATALIQLLFIGAQRLRKSRATQD